jgi:hypothetical protein
MHIYLHFYLASTIVPGLKPVRMECKQLFLGGICTTPFMNNYSKDIRLTQKNTQTHSKRRGENTGISFV